MRSDRTFNQELESVGGIPGVLFPTENDYTLDDGRAVDEVVRRWLAQDDAFDSPRDQVVEPVEEPEPGRWIGGSWRQGIDLREVLQGDGRSDRAGTFLDDLELETGIDVRGMIDLLGGTDRRADLARAVADLGTDAFGLYLPWHAFVRSRRTPWGMYFFFDNMALWSITLRARASAHGLHLSDSQSLYAVFWIVYRHELFHFHVERFALRHEVLIRAAVFVPYVKLVRRMVAGTEEWLEEALAQAVVLQSQLLKHRLGLDGEGWSTLRRVLVEEFRSFPDGYRHFECEEYDGPEAAHRLLAAQIIARSIMPDYSATDAFTPKREYASDANQVPGYLVLSGQIRGQLQLQMPQEKRFRRFASREGIEVIGPGPGDHQRVRVNGHVVHLNTHGKEMDLASMKAVARARGQSLASLLREIRSA